jgi:hypothetical protein
MLRELISRFTKPGTPPPVLSQVSQLSLSQRPGILLATPSTVAKVATVAVAIVENPKIGVPDQPAVERKGASAPGPAIGLEWSPWPAEDGDLYLEGKWAVFDLRDVCRSCGLRIVRAGERILAVYPPALDTDMIEYAEALLDDARPYLVALLDKLPILTPAQAVEIIKDVIRHKGLRFTRGEGGSMWPLYPTTWTAGQKATVQRLWLVAGKALDADSFEGTGRLCLPPSPGDGFVGEGRITPTPMPPNEGAGLLVL